MKNVAEELKYLRLLLTNISNGDLKSFEKLYHYFYQRLVRFSRDIVKKETIAEEVIPDVFIKIWENKASLTEIENITSYLFKSVKNASLNRLYEEKKFHSEEIDEFVHFFESELNPEKIYANNELNLSIKSAIKELPPKCRIIFKLAKVYGLRYKEISEILNISVRTIDAQMAIAVKKISETIKKNL